LMLRFVSSFLQISHFEKTMGVPSGGNPSLGDDVNLNLKIMIYPEGKSVPGIRVKIKNDLKIKMFERELQAYSE